MAKVADTYFKVDEWKIIEKGFQPEYAQVAESVFSQANEYMGTRGFFEEGYTGKHLCGSYFNGVYEAFKGAGGGYKGISNVTEFMVNAVNWLYTRISVNGKTLNLAEAKISNYQRVLDMKSGLLTRSFVWEVEQDVLVRVGFERLISMQREQMAAQRIRLEAVKGAANAVVLSGLDFSGKHQSAGKNFWNVSCRYHGEDGLGLAGTTHTTKFQVLSSCRIQTNVPAEKLPDKQKCIANRYSFSLKEKERVALTKLVSNTVCKERQSAAALRKQQKEDFERCREVSFDVLLKENKKWWADIWEKCDIRILGDTYNQQGIRFCIFQMCQTYHGVGRNHNIGAKGLTGEAYNGNAFWDTETYCLPFFLFQNREAAKKLLMFRYETLPEARKRAKELDCAGAFYPVATISGKESCGLWQHASLQLQASTGVAYGIWHYEKVTGDKAFVYRYGLPMLIEISRMLATRGDWNAEHTRYGYYCVMGPDEFQMMVNHNCYTNLMGKFTLRYTCEAVKRCRKEAGEIYQQVCAETGFSEKECEGFSEIEAAMYLPKDEQTGIYEQQEGYFGLPHIDVDAIPVEEFPLYNHWSYDRIYRNDMIKQPDVLMFMLLFNSSFPEEELRKNYDFYEPRCIHESSLSPSVHSILATQLGKHEEAYEFFRFATRMDLDNYNRNTAEGLHTTSIAAAWLNIVYGFGGLRSDGECLSLWPVLPKGWSEYSFRLEIKNDVLCVEVSEGKVTLHFLHGSEQALRVYGKDITVGAEAAVIAAQARGEA